MTTLPTPAELYAAGKAEIQRRQPALTDFSEGSNLDAVNGGGAVLADEVIRVLVDQFKTQFIDTAEDQELDDLADDRFGISRKAANPAVGSVTFTRGSSTGVLPFPAGTTVSGTVDGTTLMFTTNVEVELSSADTTVDAVATCTSTGRDGNVDVGIITKVIDLVPGDPDATVTNASRFTGGVAVEKDSRFRDRLRRYFTTLRKGTVAALEAGALGVGGVEYATVDESFMAYASGGYVGVYVGDPDARANAELVAIVDLEMLNWRAVGIKVLITAAEREEVTLSLAFIILRGSDQDALRTGVRQAILEYVNGIDAAGDVSGGLGVGETLQLARMLAQGMRVSDNIIGGSVTSHAVNLTPTQPYNAIRVLDDALSITFTETA